jgi:hypothetical protein
MTPSLHGTGHKARYAEREPEAANSAPRATALITPAAMEQLWRQAGATIDNQLQTLRGQRRAKQAKTVAMDCHRLPIGAHDNEGINGSSPLEGFTKGQQMASLLS